MMLALLLLLAVAAPQAGAPQPTPTESKVKALPPGVLQIEFDSIHCESCAKQIARNLYKTPGVKRVQADIKQNLVQVTAQPKKQIDLAQVWKVTHTKDATPVRLRIGKQVLVAKDFEEAARTAAKTGPQSSR